MSNWKEIQERIAVLNNINPYDMVRVEFLGKLFRHTHRNTICYYSGWLQKTVAATISEEDMNAFMNAIHRMDRKLGLDLVLHTPGGDLAATEAIVKYLIKMFDGDIRAIIPQISMSAGTMMACACKEIIMGKQSSIGPIDPQYMGVAAQAIVEEFENAIKAIKSDPATIPIWREIISKYHPTFIGECQKAIQFSEELCGDWLKANMFKENQQNIKDVVSWLSSHGKSKTHARHFDIDTCKAHGLSIIDLEADNELQDIILSLHHSYMHTFSNTSAVKIIENQFGNRMIFQLNQSNDRR